MTVSADPAKTVADNLDRRLNIMPLFIVRTRHRIVNRNRSGSRRIQDIYRKKALERLTFSRDAATPQVPANALPVRDCVNFFLKPALPPAVSFLRG